MSYRADLTEDLSALDHEILVERALKYHEADTNCWHRVHELVCQLRMSGIEPVSPSPWMTLDQAFGEPDAWTKTLPFWPPDSKEAALSLARRLGIETKSSG